MTFKHSIDSLDQTFWTQATWFIDPANSTGLASDNNTGLDAAHPVLSYNGGVAAKWGTVSPILSQDTTLTWLSSQTTDGNDPIVFTPVLNKGAVPTLTASLVLTHGGVVAAGVTPKNRTTGQLLEVNLTVAGLPIGTLVHNTTAGKNSYAYVYANTAGTTYTMSQPLGPATLPLNDFTGPATEVDTWANGDTLNIYDFINIDLVTVAPTMAGFDAAGGFPAAQLVQLSFEPQDGGNGNGNVLFGYVSAYLCQSNKGILGSDSYPTGLQEYHYNCAWLTSCISYDSFVNMWGGLSQATVGPTLTAWSYDFDVIVDSFGGGGSTFAISSPSLPVPLLGAVYVADFLQLAVGGAVFGGVSNVAGLTTAVLWGPGTLNILGVTRLHYSSNVGGAVSTFPLAGGLQLNSLTTATTFVPASGTWIIPAAITPANLDNAAVFAGNAILPGGSSITNEPL
jgi:hypothetical protein